VLVSKRRRSVVLAFAAFGSSSEVDGTSNWMLGTFSGTSVGNQSIGLADVAHYDFAKTGP
jgi:hypothetical protein